MQRPLVSILAQKYGKRPQFLFAAATGTLGTVVCVVGTWQARGYRTLLAGRMVQGLGVTAWESVSLAAVGDLFYLHERGLRTAAVVCSLACMASLVSIVSGVVFQRHGYRTLFAAALPFDVAGLLATVFLLPETQYARRASASAFASRAGPRGTSVQAQEVGSSEKGDQEEPGVQSVEKVSSAERVQPARGSTPRKSYRETLAPWSGTTYTDKGVARLLAGIFVHLANPAVFWILMVSAVLICFFVASAYMLSQVFSAAPYGLDVAQNGYVYTGAFVGGVLAVGVGPLCDWTARALARRNRGGVFEAEFRIPVNALGAVFVGLGWFLFMWVVDHPAPRGYLLGSFAHGCVCFGISVPSTSAGLYIL